jgi:hypothetical protein
MATVLIRVLRSAEKQLGSASDEAARARPFYEDIVQRIKQFQSNLEADEKMLLSIGGALSKTIGVRGPTN